MRDVLAYAAIHWGVAAIFMLAALGAGQIVCRVLGLRVQDMHALWTQCTAGLGLLIFALQWVAVAGMLTRGVVWLMLGGLGAMGVIVLVRGAARWRTVAGPAHLGAVGMGVWLGGLLLVAAVVVPLFFVPLRPPYVWDELMYHLPHAKEWAATGRLTVNEWLRLPWSPMGMSVLYAAALLVQDDVLTHLFNAIAGFGCALLIWSFRRCLGGAAVALAAALLWLLLAADEFQGATADLGLSLFVLAAFLSVVRWLRDKSQSGWLLMAAFLAGVALSVKYHAVMFVAPLPLVIVYSWLRREISARTVLHCSLAMLLPCAYWYARNWMMTGNPVNPLAPSVFGYYDWSPADMALLHKDLRVNAHGWPSALLLPAALAPLVSGFFQSTTQKATYVFCAYSFVVWWVTSHYARYLLPVYPVLALLSVSVMVSLANRAIRLGPAVARGVGSVAVIGAGVLLVQGMLGRGYYQAMRTVPTTDQQIEDFLQNHVQGYAIAASAKSLKGEQTYQWRLENMVYYLLRGIRGEVFGHWRYGEKSERADPPEEDLRKIDLGARIRDYFA